MKNTTFRHTTCNGNISISYPRYYLKSIFADFVWRGGKRRGKISWLWRSKENPVSEDEDLLEIEELPDWELIICPPTEAEIAEYMNAQNFDELWYSERYFGVAADNTGSGPSLYANPAKAFP